MRVTFESVGDFNNTIKWLEEASRKVPREAMNAIGREGVAALKANTPVATGATANGWDYKIETSRGSTELIFVNNAHQDENISIARIIDSGHGTGTGGYVPPRPYIKQAIGPVLDRAANKLMKEMMD